MCFCPAFITEKENTLAGAPSEQENSSFQQAALQCDHELLLSL